jgi:hypothetical protein
MGGAGSGFLTGLFIYYQRFPVETVLSLATIPYIVLLFRREVRETRVLLLAAALGLAHFVGYSILGVYPYHWYYAAEISMGIFAGGFGVAIIYREYSARTGMRRLLQTLLLLGVIIPCLGMFFVLAKQNFRIAEMPVNTNWATQAQYREVGLWLNKRYRGSTISMVGEIGTLAYYCDCYLLNEFTDRAWLGEYINKNKSDTGMGAILLRANYHFYRDDGPYPIPGYAMVGHPNVPGTAQTEDGLNWETSTKWNPQGMITFERSGSSVQTGP